MAKKKKDEQPISATYEISFGDYPILGNPIFNLKKQKDKFGKAKFKIVLKEDESFKNTLDCVSEALSKLDYKDEKGEVVDIKERDKMTNDAIAALIIPGLKKKQHLDEYLCRHNMLFDNYEAFEKAFNKLPIDKIHHLAILCEFEEFPVTLKYRLKKKTVEQVAYYTIADSKNIKFPLSEFKKAYMSY